MPMSGVHQDIVPIHGVGGTLSEGVSSRVMVNSKLPATVPWSAHELKRKKAGCDKLIATKQFTSGPVSKKTIGIAISSLYFEYPVV